MSVSPSRSKSWNAPRGSRSSSRAPALDDKARYTCGEHYFGRSCDPCRKGYLQEKRFTTHISKEHLQGVSLAYIVQTKERCCRDHATDMMTLFNHIRTRHIGPFSPTVLKNASMYLSPEEIIKASNSQGHRIGSATTGYKAPDTVQGASPYPSHPTPVNANSTNAESAPITPNISGTTPDEHYTQSSHVPSSQWSAPNYQQPGYASEGNSFNSPGPFQPWSANQYPGFQ